MTENASGMPKAYDHHQVETFLYEWWERNGYFRPDTQVAIGQSVPGAAPFVISMPPPNVTGALHLGHAITNSVEDMLIRYNRMLGRPTLWVPGTDHAGIATQNVVERQLEVAGTDRHETGSRGLRAGGVGLEGRVSRPHHRSAEAHGHLLRLGTGTFHAGRRTE